MVHPAAHPARLTKQARWNWAVDTKTRKYAVETPELKEISNEGEITTALLFSSQLAEKITEAICLGRHYRLSKRIVENKEESFS